jgi:small subunit ribosomal protein S16
MVRIRLKRTGTRNLPCYRVVVVDQRSTRDGRTIEEIGFYDPCHDTERLDVERYDFWIARGAQPSNTAADLARRAKDPETEAKKKAEAQAKADAAAQKKAEEEAAAKAAAEKEAKAKADAEAKAKAEEEAAAAAEEKAEEPKEKEDEKKD